jgi:hypothetical protein
MFAWYKVGMPRKPALPFFHYIFESAEHSLDRTFHTNFKREKSRTVIRIANKVSSMFNTKEQAASTGPEDPVDQTHIDLVPPIPVCAANPAPGLTLLNER